MKKHLLKGFLLVGLLCALFEGNAQDIHFSQYNAAPLQLNPALAGLNACDYRVYTDFRLQWPTISDGYTYRTLAAGADMAIGKVTKFNSYAGLGLSFSSDQAGAINYSWNRVNLTFAYHFMLNAKGTMAISAGLQGSFNNQSIDASKATFDANYFGLPGENFGRTNLMYGDAGLGAMYSAQFRHNVEFYSGFALDHVNQPKISFYPSGQGGSINDNDRLYMKITFHGGMSIPMSKRVSLLPNYAVFIQGPSNEFDLGCSIKTVLDNNATSQTTAILFGAQYRGLLDAAIFSARLDYKGFSGGLSYDMNISKLLPASKSVGAPEITLVYQGCMRKKPHPGHCPEMF